MYFNEKEDTNIDKEFKQSNKIDPDKAKKYLLIGGLILLLLIIVIIAIFVMKNHKTYYLELNGGSEISVYEGSEFIDPGYIAYDNKQNVLTDSVVVSGDVNINVVGTYTLTYTIKDKSATRTVNVIASQSQYTKIYLEGEKTITIKVGQEYVEPGYYYNDMKAGDMRDKIVVNGTVDTSKPGKYRITYTVTNTDNVTITAERLVIVEE